MKGYRFLTLMGCIAALAGSADRLVAADATDAIQKNRETVARDYGAAQGSAMAVRIAMRGPTGSGRGAWKVGEKVAVLARLKSGEEVVIDEVDGGELDTREWIVDANGITVGFFRKWTTKEDIWHSARGAFSIYLAGPGNVFLRTGEVKCRKTQREGLPMVTFANGRWKADLRELEFNVRASCSSVNYFGIAGGRQFLTLDRYTGADGSHTEEDGRLVVALSQDGDVSSVELLTGSADEARAYRKCKNEGRLGGSFRVCGPNGIGDAAAFWSSGGATVEHEFFCDVKKGAVVSRSGIHLHSCYGAKVESATAEPAWLAVEIATQEQVGPVKLMFTCSTCTRFSARRLAFDPAKRTVSFNLDADGRVIEFEGGSFEVPAPAAKQVDGRAILPVPVISARLNEQWQVVELSASNVEAQPQGEAPGKDE